MVSTKVHDASYTALARLPLWLDHHRPDHTTLIVRIVVEHAVVDEGAGRAAKLPGKARAPVYAKRIRVSRPIQGYFCGSEPRALGDGCTTAPVGARGLMGLGVGLGLHAFLLYHSAPQR